MPDTQDLLYKDVKSRLVASLREGHWKPGEMLPSESGLAELYDVGVSTIRKAVGELAQAGLVVRRQGKGTFVAVHGDQRSVYRFFNVVRDGCAKELPVSELISLSKGPAEDEVADLLELPRSRQRSEVFTMRNVLRIGDTPVVVSDITVPADLFKGLTAKVIREHGKTLYAVFQQRFGVTIVRIKEELKAIPADAVAREFFGLKAREPILGLRRIAYTFGGVPVEARHSRIDTTSTHYQFEQGDDV